jgi:hypothetical protein
MSQQPSMNQEEWVKEFRERFQINYDLNLDDEWPKEWINVKDIESFISTLLAKREKEVEQRIYIEMIGSEKPLDLSGTARTPEEYSENMKKFIKEQIETHKEAIIKLESLVQDKE